MITSDEATWVIQNYPGLVPVDNVVAGTIEFTATYDPDSHRFQILKDGTLDEVGGIKLACTYNVRISQRETISYSELPAVHVIGVDPVPDRHFTTIDNSACLCSPIEEREFLEPAFDFRKFLELLIIPFLYGQRFYSEHGHWPWREYAHGATGLLESYGDVMLETSEEVQKFLSKLARDPAWPNIRVALERPQVKGHLPCFCPKKGPIRRCHPLALDGIRKLQKQLQNRSIPLPSCKGDPPAKGDSPARCPTSAVVSRCGHHEP